MVDVLARIFAELDRREHIARAATGERWSSYGTPPYEVIVDEDWGDQETPTIALEQHTDIDAEHIALHDPADALAEIAMARDILARHAPETREAALGSYTYCSGCEGADCNVVGGYPCPDVRALARRYVAERTVDDEQLASTGGSDTTDGGS